MIPGIRSTTSFEPNHTRYKRTPSEKIETCHGCFRSSIWALSVMQESLYKSLCFEWFTDVELLSGVDLDVNRCDHSASLAITPLPVVYFTSPVLAVVSSEFCDIFLLTVMIQSTIAVLTLRAAHFWIITISSLKCFDYYYSPNLAKLWSNTRSYMISPF